MAGTLTRTPFAIRTRDAAWIAGNSATVRDDAWVLFPVLLADIEVVRFCGNDHLRYRLPDLPRDFGNRHSMCPAVIIRETAGLVGASTRLSADALARMAEVERWKSEPACRSAP